MHVESQIQGAYGDRDAEGILKRLGVSHSTFINKSYRAVVEANGIPLSLYVPNKAAAKVLRNTRKPVKRKGYAKARTLKELTTTALSRQPSMRRIEYSSTFASDEQVESSAKRKMRQAGFHLSLRSDGMTSLILRPSVQAMVNC